MFVTFEGPEGGGKSTLIRALSEKLMSSGIEVIVTREPGAGNVGTAIREILLHGESLDPKAELLLFLADRAQHSTSVIRPALARGAWVLCDRYSDSTVVYQGYARGMDIDKLREWNAWATTSLKPQITFLLDLDPEIGLKRIQAKDRLDGEPIEFHRKVRNGFLAEAKLEPERWIILPADQPAEHVLELALQALTIKTKSP
jgi:dTMP kinase